MSAGKKFGIRIALSDLATDTCPTFEYLDDTKV